MATKVKEEAIVIHPIKIQTATVRVVGDTPLITHEWTQKAKLMMLESQTGKAKGKKKEPKNPAYDFVGSFHWMTGKPEYSEDSSPDEIFEAFHKAMENGATYGFPATGFKQAAMSAAYRLGWVKNQMGMRGAFFIDSDENGLVEIKSDFPVMREDPVKINMTADLHYRPQFNNWYADLEVSYNASGDISFENILNAINAGGFVCGIGEWRPERNGDFGRFHVESVR